MSFPTYQMNIWDVKSNSLKEIIPVNEGFNLTWTKLVTDIGVMAFTISEQERDVKTIFQDDNIIDIKRVDPDGNLVTEESYFVRAFNRITAEDGIRAVIGGFSLNYLIAGRVLDPDDDSTQPNGGFCTKAGDAAQVIRAYVREQLGDLASSSRSAPRFSVPLWPNSGTDVGANLRYENLWKEMHNLALSGNTDLQIVHDGKGNLELEIQTIGTDRTVTTKLVPPYLVFSPERGNISNPRYKLDRRKEENVIYTLGEGEGANRDLFVAVTAAASNSIYARRESRYDARQTKKGDTTGLRTEGIQESLKQQATIEFEFDLIPNQPGAIYHSDWELGDIGTFKWGDIQQDRRIIGIDVTLDENGEQMKITMGELK